MIDWNKMKEDISKGLKEGAETVKDGAGIVAKKAGEMSAEGQRKVKILRLKRHIHEHMGELGAALYNAEKTNPGTITDGVAKGILEKIEQANADLLELEKSP